ncbi:MAG: hypothetical protein VYA71_04950 [Pseudomonadota bacterium]|nr:hypothetical protein [Pseudomonadota bacterium]
MLKVLVADKVSPSAIDVFRANGIDATVETGLAEQALTESVLEKVRAIDGITQAKALSF